MLLGTVRLLPIHFRGEFVQLICQSAALGAAFNWWKLLHLWVFLSPSLLEKEMIKKENNS